MSVATLILGNSGSGKTTSLQNLDPEKTLLIQCLKKPLPFKRPGWKVREDKSGGNIYRTDDPIKIEKAMRGSSHDIIVIDDYQAVLVNQLMGRCEETGFKKFEAIGKSAWDIFNACGDLAEHRRVYLLAHTQTDDLGNIKMRTVGKMVDNVIVPEGYFTIVLRTNVTNGVYTFSTQTNGQDCCKSPVGMFSDYQIENDLHQVDNAIVDFYSIKASE
jgi:hypothetical protein